MQFIPKSAEEIADEGLLPEGDYDFVVQSAEDSTSKSGNEMIVLDLQVFDSDGGSRTIRDYLVSTDKGLRKIRSFAVTTGILSDYDRGRFEAGRLVGLPGMAKIKKDPNPGFEPKNVVAWYLDPAKRQNTTLAAPARQPATTWTTQGNTAAVRRQQPVGAGADDLDDSIPF